MNTQTLSMDVAAKDGSPLRMTLHRTDEGHIELDSLVEISEYHHGRLRRMATYRLNSILAAERDLNLHDLDPGLTIERPWLVTFGDWVQLMTEALVDNEPAKP